MPIYMLDLAHYWMSLWCDIDLVDESMNRTKHS